MSRRQYFAQVRWTPEDVMTMADHWDIPMTRKQAEAWLRKVEKHISDRMVERGWEAIDTMLYADKDLFEQDPLS